MIGMDMGRILTIFNSMKNVNISGTPASEVKEEEEVEEVEPTMECVNCSGMGQIDLGWGETVPCRECDAKGSVQEAILAKQRVVPTFKPGDTVEFCGEYATVIKDRGDDLVVDLGGGEGKCTWYKEFQGEPVRLVKKSIKEYSDGKDSGVIGDDGAEDEGPLGKYGAGQMWQRDEMDFPPEHSFKDEIAGEKFSDEAVNDHDLTVNDQLEQEGLEEGRVSVPMTPQDLKAYRDSQVDKAMSRTSHEEISHIEDQYNPRTLTSTRKIYFDNAVLTVAVRKVDKEFESKVTLAPRKDIGESADKSLAELFRDQMEQLDKLNEEEVSESAPPDQEDWVKKNKKRFKKEYGNKEGEKVLYATSWKKHNKEK